MSQNNEFNYVVDYRVVNYCPSPGYTRLVLRTETPVSPLPRCWTVTCFAAAQ